MTAAHRWIALHVFAVANAAFGLIVLIPHPELWAHLPGATYSYNFSMQYMGALHMILGAVAMVAVGRASLGARRTWIFFAAAVGISLTFELLGTGTGWPFGKYAYTQGLGYKILGLVPFSIPLSWFYLAFSSYLLARRAVARWAPGLGEVGTVALGTWLLTAWDLVLDPAMAHPEILQTFWVWEEPGPYLGMPLENLLGWLACGTLMMGVSRALWGAPLDPAHVPAREAYAVYATNLLFGVVICASVGLWWPIGLAFVAGLAPAALALAEPASLEEPADEVRAA